jgi:pSer/pThr/pTyr-binding forkhead associated (FHA) protein
MIRMRTYLIGRDSNADIVINDDFVSRQHAQLTLLDSDRAIIRDLQSKNGTFVNGVRIIEKIISHGDIVKCGLTDLSWKHLLSEEIRLVKNKEIVSQQKAHKPLIQSSVLRFGLPAFVLIAISLFFIFGRSKIRMSKEEAKDLVVKSIGLPRNFQQTISGIDAINNVNVNAVLEEEGYITKSGSWLHGYSIYPTEKGQQFTSSTGQENIAGTKTVTFRTFSVEFGEITGIAYEKSEKTASIRFTLIPANITPIGQIMFPNIYIPKQAELKFKYFDTGWQLADPSITRNFLNELF